MKTPHETLCKIVRTRGPSMAAGKGTAVHRNNRHKVRRRIRHWTDAGLRRWHRYCYEKKPPTLPTTPHFLLRRKTLLLLACLILLAGAVLRPLSFLALLWGRKFIAVLVAGFLGGALVRELAAVCLGTKGRLWYTRWAATVFVLIAIMTINALFPIADRILVGIFGIGPFFSSAATAYVLVGMELVGIALLR